MIAGVTSRERTTDASVGSASQQVWWRSRLETGLIGMGLVALLVLLSHHVYSDAEVRYQAISALLLHGTLDSSQFSLIGPLFSTPIWFLGTWLHLPHRGLGLYNWCVFTVGIGALYWLLKDHVDRSLLRTFILVLIAGSMFPFHLTNYYGEVFTAVCVAVGLVAVQVRRPLLGWTAVVLGVANTPATLIALGFVVVVQIVQTRRLRNVLPFAVAAVLIATENWIRRGGPFASNYGSYFGWPFFGLLAILFSFGKGLIFFTPGLFLPIRHAVDGLEEHAKRLLASTHVLWIVFVMGLVAVYSGWLWWDGGWFWGPRFFLFASFPASLALALGLHRRGINLVMDLVTLLVLGLSVWVDVNGAVYGDYPLFNLCVGNNYAHAYYCNYLPSYSVLWYPLTTPQPLNWLNIAYIIYCFAVFVYLALPLLHAIVSAFLALSYQVIRAEWRAWHV